MRQNKISETVWITTHKPKRKLTAICIISEKRERLADEIIPDSAEHSGTLNNNEEKYAAAHAIDLDLDTRSYTSAGSDGKSWFKVNLAQLNCIHQVRWYYSVGRNIHYLTWTCSSSDCSNCRGHYCDKHILTTSSERTSSDYLPLIADCKHGDTVKSESPNGAHFWVLEIAITGKQGEIRYLY